MRAGGHLELSEEEAHASTGDVKPMEDRAARVRVLGLPFFAGAVDEGIGEVLEGGLVVAPAGPAMAGAYLEDSTYRAALLSADVVLPDSGAMVLFWNARALFTGAPLLHRLSGLRLFDALLADESVRRRRTFWVMPSATEAEANLAWLRRNGFPRLGPAQVYVAPRYERGGEITDPALLARIEAERPELVFVNLGGGTQEPLGAWLKAQLSFRPAIICTGAAIAFRSGMQAAIPPWADALYLGWLLRVWSAPKEFWPRYWRAWRLAAPLWKLGEKTPPPPRR